MRFALFTCLLVFGTQIGLGGQYNRVLSIGDSAPGWSDLIGVDGVEHSLADLEDKSVVVVVFLCTECPYALDAEDRLIALSEKFKDRGVAIVAVNVNKIEDEPLLAMKEQADRKAFDFPYLFDDSQQIARDYGAKWTPEFFVLDSNRKIAYMGAQDDSPDGKAVSQAYVDQAIESLLNGQQPKVTETIAVGCRIRMQRQRRRRRE